MQTPLEKRPPKYWNAFERVEEELFSFIAANGSPRVMPTRKHLKAAGRADLCAAIDRHGGFEIVAERLALTYTGKRYRPMGYWSDPTHVVQELREAARELGAPDVMPSETALLKAGKSSLVRAIHRHGHFDELARLAGLQMIPIARPSGFWNEQSILEEISAFNRAHGTEGIMPTRRRLMEAGREDLASAIDSHGGYRTLAKTYGFVLAYTKQDRGHWDNLETVVEALLQFVAEHGTPAIMPTASQLRAGGMGALLDAISRKHGGLAAVARQAGLLFQDTTKEDAYWSDRANVRREVQAYIHAHGTEGVMPTYTELQRQGYASLCAAIRQHGGFADFAQQEGLIWQPQKKTNRYYDDFSHLEQELRQHNERYHLGAVMPTSNELRAHGYSSLILAFRRHGGAHAVALRLGLSMRETQRQRGKWTEATLAAELRAFMREHNLTAMPTSDTLRQAGRNDLNDAVTKLGGYPYWAEKLGVPGSGKRPPHFWTLEQIKLALEAFNAERGTPGLMPRQRDLQEAGRYDLVKAIQEEGGAHAVALQFGWQYDGQERLSQKTLDDVERVARALQPLAESHLLSSAHLGIILRRAGLLAFHHSRIRRLNTSLLEGQHDLIEQAITLLSEPMYEEEDPAEAGDAPAFESGSSLWTGAEEEETTVSLPVSGADACADIPLERATLHGLSALGGARLPLDEVLGMLTSRLLWDAFYRRLYHWYGSLHVPLHVTDEEIHAVVFAVYPETQENEFICAAAQRFVREVQLAVQFVVRLRSAGWQAPDLRLHQADAARRMTDVLVSEEKHPFLLNADEPGLGKSAAFLAAVYASRIEQVLLIAPKIVADETWCGPEGEIQRCLPHAHVVRGLPAVLTTFSQSPGVPLVIYVLHYEELLKEEAVQGLTSCHVDCLCIDEAHMVKQRAWQGESGQRQALDQVRRSARVAIGLTGTPLVNELAEPLSLLQLLSHHDPRFEYTRLRNSLLSDNIDVFEVMLPSMTRRRKELALQHLPSCQVRAISVSLPHDLDERIRSVSEWPRREASAALQELRKLTLEAKLPYIRERAQQGGKLLILTYQSTDISECIAQDLEAFFPGEVAHINHAVQKAKRRSLIQAFRNAQGVRLLVGTVRTIGTGLTLFDPTQKEMAHQILVADLPYTAAEFDQGIARLHREGQKHRVQVDVLLARTSLYLRDGSPLETIDEQIWNLVLGKGDLARRAIDGVFPLSDDAAHVRRALRRWLERARSLGTEPLEVYQRSAGQSAAERWRWEVARLRGMPSASADRVFHDVTYQQAYLAQLAHSPIARTAQLWIRGRLRPLLRPELQIVDMGCGLNPFADLPCRVTGLDRFDRPGQLVGKMEATPFADDSADVLLYCLSLYGTPDDLTSYFKEAVRLLRRGGHLLIVEPRTAFTQEGLACFVSDLNRCGFDLVEPAYTFRSKGGGELLGMHLRLTGEYRQPELTRFRRA